MGDEPLNAMILAAGRGTRLGRLGSTTPKVMVEVDGEPLLARQLRYLVAGGVGHIVINVHHLAEQVERFVEFHPMAADIEVVREPELLGTAGGVRNALPRLGDKPFVVLYGDVISDEPIAALWETHRRARALATLSVYEADDPHGKGLVRLAADRRVTAFLEKPRTQLNGRFFVNAGLYVLDPELIAALPLNVPLDFGHETFPAALARGERVVAHLLDKPVVDIGTPSALQRARWRAQP